MEIRRIGPLLLLVLLLISVLASPALAAETYVFERYVFPAALADDFEFGYTSEYGFCYPGEVPKGEYLVDFGGFTVDEPITLLFDNYEPDGDFYYSVVSITVDLGDGISGALDLLFAFAEGVTLVLVNDTVPNEGSVLILSRAGSLPSSGVNMSGMMSGVVEQMHEFSTVNLLTILGATVGACVGVVIIWFGYRYSKRKISSALKKGKM